MRRREKKFYAGKEPVVYIIVNTDLKMKVGKILSQCSHAIFKLANDMHKNRNAFTSYLRQGQPKIILKGTTNDICEIYGKLRLTNIYCTYIRDAGRTQVPSGSLTVLLIFGCKEELKKDVGHLKIF